MNKICISEPDDDNPKTPLTPEAMERTPDEKPNKNQLTPTINEENELDEHNLNNNKSSLSLPVEPPVTPVTPVERDRRKLSVQGTSDSVHLKIFISVPFIEFLLCVDGDWQQKYVFFFFSFLPT